MTRPTGSPTGPASGPTALPPISGGEQIIAWWQAHGRDPRDKLLIFSDGMDVDLIEATYRHFDGRRAHQLRLGHQSDQRFPRLRPDGDAGLAPISLVCKVIRPMAGRR